MVMKFVVGKINMENKMRTQSLTIKLDDMYSIDALTNTQADFFEGWKKKDIHVLHGVAGTGKTFISLYKALEEVLEMKSVYKKLIILRSAVAARDIGALPGDLDEKGAVYEMPYYDMCDVLFKKDMAYTRLKEQGKIRFALTSYIRGITFDNSIIVVDEIQNLNYQELYSVMTRVGENSKILFCGDYRQSDLRDSGLHKFLSVLSLMDNVNFLEFTINDIVRSDLVRQFIIAEESFNDNINMG